MKMFLFLNESYIFDRLRMWSTVLWHLCVFVCAECGNAYYRGAGVPYKTLFRACDISFFGQKEYPNFRFGPSYRSLLSKPIFSLL
ncbi:BBT_HP_G0073120.mRNA.1.CDS.1 [Saccharomyces cerevisiae]|nr:BBT_HP_G0073120.mRNA.1.CDS.1 [Saccharomyces cerevisiae]CAI6863833.1 BBT_HP_G0073120.mRNA.1.CDS.1 [Saccharomyces cerevisiae]